MRARRKRSHTGVTIVEFAAALVLGLPMIVFVIYAALEANFLFSIRTNLDLAVRRAAQLLINDYSQNGTPQADGTTTNLPSTMGFTVPTADGHYFIRNDSNQFTWTWDLTDRPNTVTVTVTYPTSGSSHPSSMVPFPYPDPLNLGKNFQILTSGTFPVPAVN